MIHDRPYKVAENKGNEQEFEARTVFYACYDHCYLNIKSMKYTWEKKTLDAQAYPYTWVLKVQFHAELTELSNVEEEVVLVWMILI